VPGKNLQEVGGHPLVAHAVLDAQEWGGCDDIVVSTDNEEIADVAIDYGAAAPFKRPDHLATDDAPKLPVIRHALSWMEGERSRPYDYVVDIDATTPLRKPKDIENCMDKLRGDDQTKNAYSVCESRKNPYINMVELDNDGYATLSKDTSKSPRRRQDTPNVYEMNAAVYVYNRDFLVQAESVHGEHTRVSVMPEERSVDIDSPHDLSFVRFMYERDGGR
jgi:N-acylneuraminate cytidylyltransferase/CMP-N,N'-diacetyllegionaminic acid synthase